MQLREFLSTSTSLSLAPFYHLPWSLQPKTLCLCVTLECFFCVACALTCHASTPRLQSTNLHHLVSNRLHHSMEANMDGSWSSNTQNPTHTQPDSTSPKPSCTTDQPRAAKCPGLPFSELTERLLEQLFLQLDATSNASTPCICSFSQLHLLCLANSGVLSRPPQAERTVRSLCPPSWRTVQTWPSPRRYAHIRPTRAHVKKKNYMAVGHRRRVSMRFVQRAMLKIRLADATHPLASTEHLPVLTARLCPTTASTPNTSVAE